MPLGLCCGDEVPAVELMLEGCDGSLLGGLDSLENVVLKEVPSLQQLTQIA